MLRDRPGTLASIIKDMSNVPLDERVAALELLVKHNDTLAHHKDWALDQVARVLAGSEYDELVWYKGRPGRARQLRLGHRHRAVDRV